MGSLQKCWVFAGHFSRAKPGQMVVARWYFPHIFKDVTEIIKYCDMCQYMSTYILKRSDNSTSYPSPSLGMKPDWY